MLTQLSTDDSTMLTRILRCNLYFNTKLSTEDSTVNVNTQLSTEDSKLYFNTQLSIDDSTMITHIAAIY